jgi:hypothetical protein
MCWPPADMQTLRAVRHICSSWPGQHDVTSACCCCSSCCLLLKYSTVCIHSMRMRAEVSTVDFLQTCQPSATASPMLAFSLASTSGKALSPPLLSSAAMPAMPATAPPAYSSTFLRLCAPQQHTPVTNISYAQPGVLHLGLRRLNMRCH